MARARSLKPAFFKNAELVELPPLTRLLFAGLWTIADREGRLEDRPKHIKLEVLPGDKCNIESMLGELEGFGFILRYEVGDKKVISIPAFHKHQKPHVKEVPSALPPPPIGRGQHQPEPGKVGASTESVVASPSLTLNPVLVTLNPEPSTPEPATASQGGVVLPIEDNFEEFKAAGIEAGVRCSNADWEESKYTWRLTGFDRKLRAVDGYHERLRLNAVDDPALKALPKNYLIRQMYDREIRAPVAPRQQAKSAIDRQNEIIQRKERERLESSRSN